MNHPFQFISQFIPISISRKAVDARGALLGLLFAVGATISAQAQGELGGGTIGNSGSGPFTYNLTFSDAANATSPIGSVWYAWVPGQFFLPSAPTAGSALAPVGWTATISGNSIQFVASSSANDITAGSSLSGFSYQASFTPAQLASASNSGKSVAYSGGLFSDGGNTFTVQVAAVPEPSTLALLVVSVASLWLAARRRFQAV